METPNEPRRPRSPVLFVGGVLTMVSGILALVTGVLLAIIGNSYGLLIDTGGAQIAVCGIATILLGIPAVIGGVCAIRRKHFSMAVAGAFTGMAAGGLWIGFFLGLAALILYAFSNEDL